MAGEREVAALLERYGFTTRGLEASGDTLAFHRAGLVLHVETKRCETARPWAWLAQAEADTPAAVVPVVAFRRSRSKWYAMIALDDLARLVQG